MAVVLEHFGPSHNSGPFCDLRSLWRVFGESPRVFGGLCRVSGESESLPAYLERLWGVSGETPRVSGESLENLCFDAIIDEESQN